MKKYKCKFCGGKLFSRRSYLSRHYLKSESCGDCYKCNECDYNYEIQLDLNRNIIYEEFDVCEKFSGEAGVLTAACYNDYALHNCNIIFHEGTKFEFEVILDEPYEIKSIEESIKFFKTYAKNTMLL